MTLRRLLVEDKLIYLLPTMKSLYLPFHFNPFIHSFFLKICIECLLSARYPDRCCRKKGKKEKERTSSLSSRRFSKNCFPINGHHCLQASSQWKKESPGVDSRGLLVGLSQVSHCLIFSSSLNKCWNEGPSQSLPQQLHPDQVEDFQDK